MKEQLKKKLQKICDDVGTEAAAEQFEALSDALDAGYESKISSGMAAIDAYREMLSDIEKIEEMLRELPKTGADLEKEAKAIRRRWNRKLSAIQGSIQSLWWLLTVAAYFFVSFTFGHWHLTWLMFLTSAIGTIIIDMLFDYNKGVSKKKLVGKLHGILWLAIVVAYFLISFTVGKWHLTWLLFILGSILDVLVNTIQKIMD